MDITQSVSMSVLAPASVDNTQLEVNYRNDEDNGFTAWANVAGIPGMVELNINHVMDGDLVDGMEDLSGVALMIPVAAAQALIDMLNAAIELDAYRTPDETGTSMKDVVDAMRDGTDDFSDLVLNDEALDMIAPDTMDDCCTCDACWDNQQRDSF